MTYEIIVRTYERGYIERHYGVTETFNRVVEIVACDNVDVVDIMDTQTGAIMLTVEDGQVTWLDTDFTIGLVNESIFEKD